MKIFKTCIFLSLLIYGCSTNMTPPITTTPKSTGTKVVSDTPSPFATETELPMSTPTASPTYAEEPTSSNTEFTVTPTPIPTVENTPTRVSDQFGVQVYGKVILPNGTGLANVSIYYAFSAYPGNALTTTDDGGKYSAFIFIPADENVRIWPTAEGYQFKPGRGNAIWFDNEFAWRHYSGYERVKLGFIAVGN